MQTFVTGTTSIGMKFKGGTLIAADKGLSYGTQHITHQNVRHQQLTNKCILTYSGDEADMQHALETVKEAIRENRLNQIPPPSAKEIHGMLSLQNYEGRNDQKPNMDNFIVAGPHFLGEIDLFGTNYETNFFANSLGRYYCMPLIRSKWNADISKEDAHKLIRDCLKVMWYNDCLADKGYDVWFITDQGIEKISGKIEDDMSVAAHKDLTAFI